MSAQGHSQYAWPATELTSALPATRCADLRRPVSPTVSPLYERDCVDEDSHKVSAILDALEID